MIRTEANRRNAQHSTGPKTKKASASPPTTPSRPGSPGRTVLLPTDDVAAWQTRAVLIEAEVYLAFQKPLANLHLQEPASHANSNAALLVSKHCKTLAASKVRGQFTEAATLFAHCRLQSSPFPLDELPSFRFEFSLAEIQGRAAEI